MTRIQTLTTLAAVRAAGMAKFLPSRPRIAVGMGTCGTGNGAEGVYHAFADAIGQRGLDVQLVQTGCFGFCAEEPLVNVWRPGQPLVMLHRVRTDHVSQILDGLARRDIPDEPRAVQDRAVGPHHRRRSTTAAGFPIDRRPGTRSPSSRARRRSCCATAA